MNGENDWGQFCALLLHALHTVMCCDCKETCMIMTLITLSQIHYMQCLKQSRTNQWNSDSVFHTFTFWRNFAAICSDGAEMLSPWHPPHIAASMLYIECQLYIIEQKPLHIMAIVAKPTKLPLHLKKQLMYIIKPWSDNVDTCLIAKSAAAYAYIREYQKPRTLMYHVQLHIHTYMRTYMPMYYMCIYACMRACMCIHT